MSSEVMNALFGLFGLVNGGECSAFFLGAPPHMLPVSPGPKACGQARGRVSSACACHEAIKDAKASKDTAGGVKDLLTTRQLVSDYLLLQAVSLFSVFRLLYLAIQRQCLWLLRWALKSVRSKALCSNSESFPWFESSPLAIMGFGG